MSIRRLMTIALVAVCGLYLSGCGTFDKAKRSDKLSQENDALKSRIAQLEKEKADEANRLLMEKKKEVSKVVIKKNREISDLEKAKEELARSLQAEIGDYQAKLKMTERGLVITFLDEIFFDSGKDVIKESGKASLDKVAVVLNNNVPEMMVAVEGYTDNEPIVHSGWKSNWELSSARSLSVLHHFIDNDKIAAERLSSVGFGENKPVADNATAEGRKQNRRVEIVILPSNINKVKAE